MKLIIFLLFSISFSRASGLPNCPVNTIRVWNGVTSACVPQMQPQPMTIQGCWGPISQPSYPFQNFPLFPSQQMPWWAYQGNLHYPNMFYPGPWAWPGIQQQYYPGQGQVFAAKPNVYLDTVNPGKKFQFKFVSSTKPHFLATTPLLEKDLSWKGKFADTDKFEVDDIYYDYLFYDVRLPKEKMQFTNGVCATREGAIQWMLKDLTEMKYSPISLQDFEEHWRVKIPDYPFYCIYPQYNRELDPVLPVSIDIEQTTFIRSLYVLVPHQKEPDIDEPQEIPFPTRDPAEARPGTRIKRENEFREWGVAFLGY